MKHLLRLIGDGLLIILCAIFLRFIFVPMLIAGEVTLYEHNLSILISETVIAALILLLGLNRLIDDFKGLK